MCVRPDGVSLRTYSGYWVRAHGLTPEQIVEAVSWLRRIGLAVEAAAA